LHKCLMKQMQNRS